MAVAEQRTHAMTDAPPTIIFHCGFHKTGSTVIQETLDKTRPLAGHDVYIVGRQAMHHSDFLPLLAQLRRPASSSDLRFAGLVSTFERLVEHTAAARILVSHEDMLGNPRYGFYRRARGAAAVLARLRPDHARKFVVYLKRQDRLVESMYKQQIQMGKSYSFAQYFSGLPWQRFSWKRVLEDLCDVIGEDGLLVRLSEDICDGPRQFVSAFIRAVLVEDFDAALRVPANTNQSFSARSLAIARLLNPYLSRRQRHWMRLVLRRVQSHKPGNRPRLLSDEDRLRILKHHEADNVEVFRRFLPDRDRCAYSGAGESSGGGVEVVTPLGAASRP
jgi:hypothetical protein